MDSSKIVFLINDQVRLIKVSYENVSAGVTNSQEYLKQNLAAEAQNGYLFKTMIEDLAVGDFVVVETATRHGMTVCKVEEIDLDVDFDDGKPLKWAIQRVDAEAFKATLAAEQEAIAAAKRAELKRKRNELRQGIFAEHAEMLEGLTLKTASLPAE